jgi:hypothetical protein
LGATGGQFEHVAVFQDKAILRRDADFLGEPAVANQVAVLAMNRHEVARAGQLEHGFEFFLAGMPRDMNLGNLFVVDLGAAAV